jgi:hypothetical protein
MLGLLPIGIDRDQGVEADASPYEGLMSPSSGGRRFDRILPGAPPMLKPALSRAGHQRRRRQRNSLRTFLLGCSRRTMTSAG